MRSSVPMRAEPVNAAAVALRSPSAIARSGDNTPGYAYDRGSKSYRTERPSSPHRG
ncbi:hypothetical protein [Actinoplanes sp. NPDC051851]|uniref:hypothetical protein n=1 Tax=Actinoplanes sp. NPDC051851 TaxID=3154753 RepID=UPI003443AFBD